MKKVSASTAVLYALSEEKRTIQEIMTSTGMNNSSVTQTLARLRTKKPAQVKRLNKRGFARIAEYGITRSGQAALRRALKKMGNS